MLYSVFLIPVISSNLILVICNIQLQDPTQPLLLHHQHDNPDHDHKELYTQGQHKRVYLYFKAV